MLMDGPLRAVHIAARLAATKQTVGPVIDELVAWNYLTRTVDPRDRRARILDFTDEGRDLVDALVSLADEMEDEWRALLGPDVLETCRTALWRIIDSQNPLSP